MRSITRAIVTKNDGKRNFFFFGGTHLNPSYLDRNVYHRRADGSRCRRSRAGWKNLLLDHGRVGKGVALVLVLAVGEG